MKRKHCSEITKMSKSPINVDEVRTLMLSLLLSHKGAMPLHKLEKDFFQEDQRYIPYLEFGHSSLLGFLQSMPEHFVVEQYSGNYYVRGIPSDKSKHVDSLVARQKVNMKHPKYVPPRFRQSFNPQTYHGYRTKPHQKAVIESNNLLALTEFIKNNPNGVSLQNALIFVRRKAPFIHISVQELRSQLQLLSHCLYLDGNMVYPIWNNLPNTGYQQPVIKKPLSQNKVLNDLGSLPIKQTECPAGQEDLDTQECFSDDNDFMLPDSINCQRWNELNDEQLATNHVEYANCEQSDTFNNAKVMNNDINKDYTPINSKNNIDMKKYLDVSEIVSDRIKCRLEELIRKHPEGIWCAQLPDLYLQEYKVPLNYNQLGFTSVREFTSYLPKIFYMEQVNKTDDFLLYSADKRPIVPKTESIDITQTRHNQYDEHNSMQARSSTDNDEDNGPIPSNIPPAITKIFAPKNVMNYNDNVEKILVTECNKKRYLEVYVVEVFHPNFFWIQLRENKRRFNKMMDELSEFYEYSNHLYTIARIALKKDMNCACVYMSRWHRAIIKTVKPDYRVTVFFYDYGTLKTYEPEDIYYLHKKFSSLPAQAIPCGLFNVKPCNSDRWKKSVVDQFIDKIADTLLAATIKSLDVESNSMMVILTDTSEEEDVHINEWLVKEKLAQYSKTADAVDMASIMRYVVNNFNQLPTYCFAEENSMSDNCCKASMIQKQYEVPLISSGPTLPHYDNHQQQQPVRPPPGFPPLGEQHIPSSLSATNLHNDYSFANASNAKTSVFSDAEMTTNPFLTDQFISNDITKQINMTIWNESKQSSTRVNNILRDLLENPLELKNQIQLSKILKIVEKVLLEQKDNWFTTGKTPSMSNCASEMTLNDIDSAQKTSYNLNSETFAKQDFNPNIFSMSNPFNMNSKDDAADRPQSNATFSTYNSDSFPFKTNWNQSDEFNLHTQMSPTTVTPSSFINAPLANTFLSNTNQDNVENIPITIPPTVPTNTSTYTNFSEFLNNVNIQFANMFKETNPFKFSMTDGMQIPEKQNEQKSHTVSSYNMDLKSHLSTKKPQSHASKKKTANIHATNNCFTPAGQVTENYTPKIVYESGPVMYNTQKNQAAEASAKKKTRSKNLDNIQNAQSLELGQNKKLLSQPANDIATSHMQQMLTRNNSQVGENYVTQPSTQDLQTMINSQMPYYPQNGNTNNFRPMSSQSWNQMEIPELRGNLKFPNNVPLSSHSESTTFGIPNTSSRLDWNCDNGRKFLPREMNEITDSSYNDKFKDGHDKEKLIDNCINFWNNTENGSVEQKNAIWNNSFLFEKIDSIKGVTFIFNIEQDGWMLTSEFVEVFTDLKLQSCLLAMLEAMNIKATFKDIQRSQYPIQFSELDRYPLNVPRDSEKRITSVNLISLQTALGLLHKLKIVSREEIENAFKKNEFLDGSILPTLWTLIVKYRDFKRCIEVCSSFI